VADQYVADPRRIRHRLPGRTDPVHAGIQPDIAKEYLVNTPTQHSSYKKGFLSCRKRGSSPATTRLAMKYDVSTWNYEEGGNVTGNSGCGGIAAGDGPATSDSGAHDKAALAQQNTAQAAGNSPNPKKTAPKAPRAAPAAKAKATKTLVPWEQRRTSRR